MKCNTSVSAYKTLRNSIKEWIRGWYLGTRQQFVLGARRAHTSVFLQTGCVGARHCHSAVKQLMALPWVPCITSSFHWKCCPEHSWCTASSATTRVSSTRIGCNATDGYVNTAFITRILAYACWLSRDFSDKCADTECRTLYNVEWRAERFLICCMSRSISETAAMMRLRSSGRSSGTGGRKTQSLTYPHGVRSGGLGGQRNSAWSAAAPMDEVDYRLDVCRVTKGGHTEHLWGVQKNLESFSFHR
jgi:hypothetical protein